MFARNSKAFGAGTGAALAVVVIWGFEQITGQDVPGEVEAALTVVVSYVVAWLFPANTDRIQMKKN